VTDKTYLIYEGLGVVDVLDDGDDEVRRGRVA